MNTMNENVEALDIKGVISIVWFNKRFIALGFFLSIIASCLFLLNSEKSYQADAVVGVKDKSVRSSPQSVLSQGNSMLTLFSGVDSGPSGEFVAKLTGRSFLLMFVNETRLARPRF